MALPDRTMQFILEKVFLKGVVVSYTIHSPTKNRKAAIEKMLKAGGFIAKYGEFMDQQSFDLIKQMSIGLVETQRTVSTRWRDVLTRPWGTYRVARDFKHDAEILLSEVESASARSKVNEINDVRRARADLRMAKQTHVDPSVPAIQDDDIVPAHPGYITAPTTLPPSIPHVNPSTEGEDIAYIRFGKSEMKLSLDSGTRIDFDGKYLTTRLCLGSTDSPESEPEDQLVRTVKRTTSVFTATGSVRIVPQHNVENGDPRQNHDEEAPTPCNFEWVEGPFVTAVRELEDEQSETVSEGSAPDSDILSD